MNESYIAMGTTPTIVVRIKDQDGDLDFDLVMPETFCFYFKQSNGLTVLKKSGLDIEVDSENSKVSTYLTQADTMKFVPGEIEVEVRFLFNDILPNGEHKAGKTTINTLAVGKVLKKEVIDDGGSD